MPERKEKHRLLDWLAGKVFKKNKQLIRFFYNYQRKYSRLAWGIGFMVLITVMLTLPMPLLTRHLIDVIIPTKDFRALHLLCLLLFGVIVVGQGAGYLLRYLTVKYNTRVHFDLERDLYCHVQTLRMSYFAKRSSGYILSRIGEVSAVESVMADTFFFVLKDFATMIVGAVLVLKLHFMLGVISLAILPFFIFSVKMFHKHIKELNKKLKEENAQYTGKLEKNINAIEKIKSSVSETRVGERLAQKLSAVLGLRIKSQMLNALAGVVSGFIGTISPFIVLWFGVSEIIRGSLTLGTFFAINSFISYLYGPARRLTDVGYRVSQAMAGLERIYEVFKENPEDPSGEPAGPIDEIRFHNVGFSYNSSEPVLDNLDLTLRKGQRVAVVGESGQGKSTLVKLILKFYHPDTGSLTFSGKDSRAIAVNSLRNKIAYVSQKQRLLEDEFQEKVESLKGRALLEKFRVQKNLDNLDLQQTGFSGGEVQKIELMEATLKEADVLIVDEGTSNIDYNSEKIVLEELFNRYRDKIIIFIAHRLNTVTGFPRIVVMAKGSVVEDGTHDQLVQKKGKYHFLWGMQHRSEE